MWGEDIPPPHEYIDRTFGRGGYLAHYWGQSYQPREPQVELARAVDRALCGRTHLLSEAPTGVGKSIAYSVPATYHAAVHGARVVIVTANIALQEQLIQKDLPLLGEVLPWAFSFALMKGRNNYLCRRAFERIKFSARQPSMFGDDDVGVSAVERERAELLEWAKAEIARRSYGDVSTLNYKPPDLLWRELSVGPDECRGSKCSFADSCGALAAQRDARGAQVVVTNYHLFFVHLLIYREKGVDAILPPFDAVVFDECFPAGTLVGDVPIETVRVGDLVDSYCPSRRRFVRRRVLQTFCRRAGRLVRLTIDGKSWVCTPGEPIFTVCGWVPADRLRIGDQVLSVQDRHRERGSQVRDRSGWPHAQEFEGPGGRREERRVATWARVDRVEVLEPGSDGMFGGLCPDGLVYNLEVEETNTYVANGVVVHNCHKAADVARDFFGWKISDGSVKRAVRYVRDINPELAERTQRAGSWFFQQMLELRRDRDRYRARVLPERLNRQDVAAAEGLLGRLEEIRAIAVPIVESADRESAGAAEVAMRGIERLIGGVSSVLSGGDDNEVLFVEEDEYRKSSSVSCRLVRPGQILRGSLFGKTVSPPDAVEEEGEPSPGAAEDSRLPVSVICTSATLVTESGFDFAQDELGAPASCDKLVVDSPFDYATQALFIIPEVCDPNDPQFTVEVAAAFLRTIVLARGRTLGLFTSRKRMNDVFDAVDKRTPFRLMRQDDGQRTQLVEEFRRDTHSVLMGVASFWAGVDVPGEALSCVFIDKLPFPTPDDPVLDRLAEADKRAWSAYAVPRAIIELKQGFGRLIRSTTDRGVVVCCDSRLVTKGYGKQFLRAMPRGMQKVRNLEAIREWLDGPEAVTAEAAEEVVDPFS